MLSFHPDGHRYEVDGQPVVSVTQALQIAKLIDFSMIPGHVLERAKLRGTAVHKAVQYDDEGRLDESSLDEEIAGHLEAKRRFYRDSGFVPGHIEVRRFHGSMRYAGTFDRTGLLGKDGVILDFKSGTVTEAHALQLAGYANLFPNPRRFRRIALQTMKTGRYKVHEYSSWTFERDTAEFFWAVRQAQESLGSAV